MISRWIAASTGIPTLSRQGWAQPLAPRLSIGVLRSGMSQKNKTCKDSSTDRPADNVNIAGLLSANLAF